MNVAAPHRRGLTAVIAAAAALLIGGIIAGSSFLDRLMTLLPPVPGPRAAASFVAIVAIGAFVWLFMHLNDLARARSRRAALEATMRGEVSCGIRSRMLVRSLNDLLPEGSREVQLARRYSIVVDPFGISFWNGGRRPQRAIQFPWREVRNIRSDTIVVGTSLVPVLVMRVRRGGTSVELPIMLGTERPGSFALSEAPFYAVVRSWKAKHRDALKAEGLDLRPTTAPTSLGRSRSQLAMR
ncbi:hypothetical protein [Agromyces albus]|uniref:hypothetical protein n=1 Tax=Agromyces albus TaxID=205332 RepID=UPI00278AC601|nr:hypothetical protein [Agromyces albus]MDQ0577510.1 hypothetical protein [Agromyces albus]